MVAGTNHWAGRIFHMAGELSTHAACSKFIWNCPVWDCFGIGHRAAEKRDIYILATCPHCFTIKEAFSNNWLL